MRLARMDKERAGGGGWIWLLLLLLAVAGGVTAGFLGGHLEKRELTELAAEREGAEEPARPEAAAAGARESLALVKAEPGLSVAGQAAAPAPPKYAAAAAAPASGGGLNEAARRSGAPVSAYTKRFRERHPVMKQYSREWLSHPDLKKLNDDYLKDHDLVRFVHGLTAAPSFGPLVRKIAADPASHELAIDFLTGLVREAPPELTASAAALLNQEHAAMGLVRSVVGALGLPPEVVSAASGGLLDATALAGAPAAARVAKP
jgi:hypothetical protein